MQNLQLLGVTAIEDKLQDVTITYVTRTKGLFTLTRHCAVLVAQQGKAKAKYPSS